jgi:thioredoxin 1
MSTLISITAADFEQQVVQSDLPIVVDFGAPWCPPCRAVAPILEDLAVEFVGRLSIVSVNTDEAPELAQRFGIIGLPTMIVFQHGAEVQRVRGAAPKRVLKEAFESALAGQPL